MHYSTREFWKVKGIHKIFIFFSRSKKTGNGQFFGAAVGKRLPVGWGESLRQPIRSAAEKACCIIRGGRTLNFGAAVGGLRLRGANSFIITAVKLRRGGEVPPHQSAFADSFLSRGSQGARAYREKEPSFLRIEKIAKKNGENRLTEANAFSII